MKTVFVSSTFQDMQFERDALRDIVSPKINEYARKYSDHIEFCDLRWGIDTEKMQYEIATQKVLEVCLDEIDRTNPPIIILLGERYGWIPDEQSLLAIAKRKQIQLDSLLKSVTALEAEYGAITLGRKALLYIRDIEYDTDLSSEQLYKDENHTVILSELKERLQRLPNCKTRTYKLRFKGNRPDSDYIELFSNNVIEDLKEYFLPDWEHIASMTPFEREQEQQWAYIYEKCSVFNARNEDAANLISQIKENQQITICKGLSGSGKSTLLSYICSKMKSEGWDVLPFIGGLTEESNNGIGILKNTLYYLEDLTETTHLNSFTEENGSKTTIQKMQERIVTLSNEYKKTGRSMLIAIDAVDQLFPDEIRDTFAFLPNGISKCIRYLLTSVPSIDFPQKQFYALKALSRDDIKGVISGILYRLGKELPERVITYIIHMKSSVNPYYVSMLVQRLSIMGYKDYQTINNSKQSPALAIGDRMIHILQGCPESIEEMCVKLFEDVAELLDADFLNIVIMLIATSRYGLRRGDLSAIISDEWNEIIFAHFINYLYEDFQIRTDGRIDFMHKTIREGLRRKAGDNVQYHNRILDHLKDLNPYDSIRMNEYPYHLILANKVEEFMKYIKIFEFDKTVDKSIVRCAAQTTKTVCLEYGNKWLLNQISSCVDKPYRNEMLWFVINELSDLFEEVQRESMIRVQLLKNVYIILKQLEDHGQLSDDDKIIFYKNLSYQALKDCGIIDDSFFAEMGDIYLGIIKQQYADKEDIQSLAILFHAYYKSLFAHKGTSNIEILRTGLIIAKEGEALIDHIESISKEINFNLFGPFFGCLGEVYRRLNDKENCLKSYLRDLEYRKKSYEYSLSSYSEMSLVGGYMNVADVYRAYGTKEYYGIAYQYYKNAIKSFEHAMQKGADILMPETPIRVYLYASKTYFLKKNLGKTLDEEVTYAIECGLKSFEYARWHARKDEKYISLLTDVCIHTSKLLLIEDIKNKGVKTLMRWLEEDSNESAINESDASLNEYIHLTTCFVVTNLIFNSRMTQLYDLALTCINEGQQIMEQIIADKGVILLSSGLRIDTNIGQKGTGFYWSDVFHEIKMQIEINKNPNNDRALLDFIEYEEEKYVINGEPSLRLASLNYDLSQYYINKKETIHLALNPLLRSYQIYEIILAKMIAEKKDRDTIDSINERIHTIKKIIDLINVTVSGSSEKQMDYGANVKRVITSLNENIKPTFAINIDERILENAISSYANNVKREDIVAISISGLFNGFFSKGRKGIIYTRDAIYSNELPTGVCIRYIDVDDIFQHADGLCFKMKDGKKYIVDFGNKQEQVFMIVTSIKEIEKGGGLNN